MAHPIELGIKMLQCTTETGTSGSVIKEGRLRWNRVERKDGADWDRRDTKMRV